MTKEESKNLNEFFVKNYPKYGKKYCMEKMNLTESQARSRAFILKLKIDKTTLLYKMRQCNPLKITAPTNKFYKTEEWREDCRRRCTWTGKKRSKKEKKIISDNMKKFHKLNPNHNTKYKTGFKFTKKQLENISMGVKKSWQDKTSGHFSKHRSLAISEHARIQHRDGILGKPEYTYSRCKHGEFDDGIKKYYMRSRWERNYAHYLNFLIKNKKIKDWEYEAETFWFEKIKRGVRSYRPDFKIYNNDKSIEYHEVKGYMDSKSKTKLKRMKKYYPNINLILIDQYVYKEISKMSGLFKGWENNK